MLRINEDPVGIKSIEHAIIDKAWEAGWVKPQPAARKTGKKVAVIGSGPAGLACAQQLARAGHEVVVFEKNDRIGGLLRYGIPDFKMEKWLIDRRMEQMRAEGVEFRTRHLRRQQRPSARAYRDGRRGTIDAEEAAGRIRRGGARRAARNSRATCRCPGASSTACTSRWSSCRCRTSASRATPACPTCGRPASTWWSSAAATPAPTASAPPTATARSPSRSSSCCRCRRTPSAIRCGRTGRRGCAPRPRTKRAPSATGRSPPRRFVGEDGKVKALKAVRLEWKDGKMSEVPGSEFELPADLVLLAMGFVSPVQSVLDAFGVEKDARGNAKADHRRARLLFHVGGQGVRRRRHAARAVAGGVGDPRGTPVRARGGRIPDGVFRAAALRSVDRVRR